MSSGLATTQAESGDHDLDTLMKDMGQRAQEAARVLATVQSGQKDEALRAAAADLNANQERVLEANRRDMAEMEQAGRATSFLDRARLDADRITGISDGLRAIADLDDPVGETIAQWTRPNGLQIERVRTPLGVIGIIYESRPNVTADAAGLCVKAGNAAVLRSGSDTLRSALAIAESVSAGLREAGLPEAAVQLVPTRDRAAVGALLEGLDGSIDVLVPRGGKSLVARVQKEARVPVFAHLEGICHVYIRGPVDEETAKRILVNSKMRRTGICGAAETLLVDANIADSHLQGLISALLEAGCTVRGDKTITGAVAGVQPAGPEDWGREYLDRVIAARVVDGLDEAVAHIERHGSSHTETIVTDDEEAANAFLRRVNSAIVMHNASTQFADGSEFGMGAEIGIATGKMHARGPIGVEQLTSFNYRVRGTGQIRA